MRWLALPPPGLLLLATCSLTPVQPIQEGDLRQLLTVQWSKSSAGYSGHGFLLTGPGMPNVAVTAYHVAGPEPGSGTQPNGWLRSPLDASVEFRLGSRVPIPGAQTIGTDGSQDDLAAFHMTDWDPARALTLADGLPQVGDTVWVLSVHVSGGAGRAGRHPALVAVAHDSALVYSYLASKNPNGTSGAAVLDRSGRVVGVNVGTLIMTPERWRSYRDRYALCCAGMVGGEVVGLAVGVGSMRSRLAR